MICITYKWLQGNEARVLSHCVSRNSGLAGSDAPALRCKPTFSPPTNLKLAFGAIQSGNHLGPSHHFSLPTTAEKQENLSVTA